MAKPSTLGLPGPVSDPNNAATDGTTEHLRQGHFSPMNSWGVSAIMSPSAGFLQSSKVGCTNKACCI